MMWATTDALPGCMVHIWQVQHLLAPARRILLDYIHLHGEILQSRCTVDSYSVFLAHFC
jgi:hypothetical protein